MRRCDVAASGANSVTQFGVQRSQHQLTAPPRTVTTRMFVFVIHVRAAAVLGRFRDLNFASGFVILMFWDCSLVALFLSYFFVFVFDSFIFFLVSGLTYGNGFCLTSSGF